MLSAKAKKRYRLNKYQALVNLHAEEVKKAEKRLEKSKKAIMRLAYKMMLLHCK